MFFAAAACWPNCIRILYDQGYITTKQNPPESYQKYTKVSSTAKMVISEKHGAETTILLIKLFSGIIYIVGNNVCNYFIYIL